MNSASITTIWKMICTTDVVVAQNGDVFVSDGHEAMSNNRIVKFSADGRYIKEWGGSGSAPGQFLVPHALALDSRGRLFVADQADVDATVNAERVTVAGLTPRIRASFIFGKSR